MFDILNYPETKSRFGGSCSASSQCAHGTNMVCLLSTCICSNPNIVYWNGTYCGIISFSNNKFLKGKILLT